MKKETLNNYYEKTFIDKKEIFGITAPLALIYKHMNSKHHITIQEKYDLNISEIDILASLLFNNKTMTPTDLYEATFLSSGGMTKMLIKLKEKKLIKRIPSKKDKRSFLVQIEPKGEELVNKCFDDLIDLDEELLSILDKEEKVVLRKTLKKVIYSILFT